MFAVKEAIETKFLYKHILPSWLKFVQLCFAWYNTAQT